MPDALSQPTPEKTAQWLSVPAVRYPNMYVWLVFLSTMDICMTWVILSRNGIEANPIANAVINEWGLIGAIGFKFALTLLAIIICETVGRSSDVKGRRLAMVMIAIASIPVVWSFVLLYSHVIMTGSLPGPPG